MSLVESRKSVQKILQSVTSAVENASLKAASGHEISEIAKQSLRMSPMKESVKAMSVIKQLSNSVEKANSEASKAASAAQSLQTRAMSPRGSPVKLMEAQEKAQSAAKSARSASKSVLRSIQKLDAMGLLEQQPRSVVVAEIDMMVSGDGLFYNLVSLFRSNL